MNVQRWLIELVYTSLQLIIVLSIPVVLVVAAMRLLMLPAFLQFEYTRPGFPSDQYGFTTEERLKYGPLGIEYLLSEHDIGFLRTQRLPAASCWNPMPGATDCMMFNPLELQHMADVKQVLQAAFAAALGFGAAALVSMLVLWQQARWRIRSGLIQGSLLTLLAIFSVIVTAALAWNVFFTLFHSLFFAPGTWQFYYSDTLIRLYPEQFWFDAALAITAFVILGAGSILFLMSRWQLRDAGQPFGTRSSLDEVAG